MKIYFACSITGGRQDEDVYRQIVEILQVGGHDVPTAVLAQPRTDIDEISMDPEEVYRRDTHWIQSCDVLIAEVTTPSHGVGYEIGYALNLEKPVLCLHKQDAEISKMISGNPHPKLHIKAYRHHEELKPLLDAFLE